MADLDIFEEPANLWEEEGLFARDFGGQLVRVVATTEADYQEDVTLTVDGEEVTVKKAVPTTDSQGNFIKDDKGHEVRNLSFWHKMRVDGAVTRRARLARRNVIEVGGLKLTFVDDLD